MRISGVAMLSCLLAGAIPVGASAQGAADPEPAGARADAMPSDDLDLIDEAEATEGDGAVTIIVPVVPPLSPAAGEAGRIVAGTPITLMVLTEVDSNRQQPGDRVKLRVHEALGADGRTILPVGTLAFGEVLATDKAGPALKKGTLAISLVEVMLGDRTVPLKAEITRKGKGGEADDALKIVLVPLYALFAPGNAAKLRAGELVSADLAEDLCFDPDDPNAAIVPCA